MDGDIQKTSITKNDSKNLNAIEESGSELKAVGKDVLARDHANNAAALAAGLAKGDLYHTAGALKIVV